MVAHHEGKTMTRSGNCDQIQNHKDSLETYEMFNKYAGELRKKIKKSVRDVLIAAICLTSEYKILTKNKKHFQRVDKKSVYEL